jgi:hypothetical protein
MHRDDPPLKLHPLLIAAIRERRIREIPALIQAIRDGTAPQLKMTVKVVQDGQVDSPQGRN